MARMVLDQPVGLPAGQLAEALRQAFPDYRWQVGDGPQDAILPLDRPATIFGRAGETMILLGIELVEGKCDAPGAPPHRCSIRLTGPSTEDRAMAGRLLAIVGVLLAAQGGGAMQLDGGGPWLDAAQLAHRAGTLPTGPPQGDDRVSAPPLSAPLQPDGAPAFPRGTGSDRPAFGRKKG